MSYEWLDEFNHKWDKRFEDFWKKDQREFMLITIWFWIMLNLITWVIMI